MHKATHDTYKKNESTVIVYECNTVVVGTGAAGLNCADSLYEYGQKDIVVVTENLMAGTSRNTGSDKQTYYKLTLSGGEADSVRDMAATLFAGECVDGDIALAEAAGSVEGFLNLCRKGVPFPVNRYGEFIGYKTDHDPKARATSIGPLTSKMMVEVLERSVKEKEITILENLLAVSVLKDDTGVWGVLCLDMSAASEEGAFVAVSAKNVVWATGGPAGMYDASVYPFEQSGFSSAPYEAGAIGKNLTEWQYAVSAIRPRWSVSGTCMQVLPRFISTDQDGGDEKEFLFEFYDDINKMMSNVFLKGYQWPFDVRKVDGGSSTIDILVYQECFLRNRRVFLDFRSNPAGQEIDFSKLDEQARTYICRAGADFGTPIERLKHMNYPAYEFFKSKGVDLAEERIEVSLCAQHNNGGLDIDCWWQTSVPGLFAIGEVAGAHGVYRPGGSALNSGQVSSDRVARYISNKSEGRQEKELFCAVLDKQLEKYLTLIEKAKANAAPQNVFGLRKNAQRKMSIVGSAIRDEETIAPYLKEVQAAIAGFEETVSIDDVSQLEGLFRYYDTIVCQSIYLGSMLDYLKNGGMSRGSTLYCTGEGMRPAGNFPENIIYKVDDGSRKNIIQQVKYQGEGICEFTVRGTRPLPEDDDVFETVWREYREHGNVY